MYIYLDRRRREKTLTWHNSRSYCGYAVWVIHFCYIQGKCTLKFLWSSGKRISSTKFYENRSKNIKKYGFPNTFYLTIWHWDYCSEIWIIPAIFHGHVNSYIDCSNLTLLLLNTTSPVLANSVDPDQSASEEANWSGSALFVIKNMNISWLLIWICTVCH